MVTMYGITNFSTAVILLGAVLIYGCQAAPTGVPNVQEFQGTSLLALQAEVCKQHEYWDIKETACKQCWFCPSGMGSTVMTCGNGKGEKGKCVDCIEGKTFQDETSTKGQCQRCKLCDENASVLTNCTTQADTQCSPCNPGYGSDPVHEGLCSLCSHFRDDEKPPGCNTTYNQDTESNSTGNESSGIDECDLNQDSCDPSVSRCNNTIGSFVCVCLSGYHKDDVDQCIEVENFANVAGLVCVPIAILVVILCTCIAAYKYHKSRRSKVPLPNLSVQKDSSSPATNGSTTSDPLVSTGTQPCDALSNEELQKCIPSEAEDNIPKDDNPIQVGSVSPGLNSIPERNYPGQSIFLSAKPITTSSGKTPRPVLRRSFSEPVDKQKCQVREIDREDGIEPLLLNDKTFTRCSKIDKKAKEQESRKCLKIAMQLGQKIRWQELNISTRHDAQSMMMPKCTSSAEKDYTIFGEAMGLDRLTDLKLCHNLEDVFEMLSRKKTTEVFIDEVLRTLKDIDRNDVVRKIVKEIVNKYRQGDASG